MEFNDELFETMLHMIGYGVATKGGLQRCFEDAVSCDCDPNILLKIAHRCNEQWGEHTINIGDLKEAMDNNWEYHELMRLRGEDYNPKMLIRDYLIDEDEGGEEE